MEVMEVNIKVSVDTMKDVKKVVEEARKIRQEYICNCTLDVTVNCPQ